MVKALKWLVRFLETRFPEKVTPVSKDALDHLEYVVKANVEGHGKRISTLEAQIDEMKKHIEILNLRVGLTRATQSPFGRK
jgi:uncharacterized protein Yka (UPF0111/DUF47 family)